jgi:hypothetical protein
VRALPAVAVLCSLCGCGGSDRRFLQPPDLDGAQSMLIALRRGEQVSVWAAPAAATLDLDAPIQPQGTARLELFAYRRDLAALAIPAGVVAEAAAGARGELVPPGDLAFQAEITGGQIGAWVAAEAQALELRTFRRALDTSCRPVSLSHVELGAPGGTLFAVSLGGGRSLISAWDGSLFSVDPDGAVVPVAAEGVPSFRVRSAFADERGILWFGGGRGELYRGRFAASLVVEQVGQSSIAESIRVIAGDPADGGRELFALTASGSWQRFANGTNEVLHQFGQIQAATTKGGTVWLGPGVGIAGVGSDDRAVWYRQGAVALEPISEAGAGITTLKDVPGYGLMAGLLGGLIYQHDGARWRLLGDSGIALDVYSLAAIEGGLLVGGAFGYLGEYYPDEGFCPPAAMPLVRQDIQYILPARERVLITGDKPAETANARVTFLGRRPAP